MCPGVLPVRGDRHPLGQGNLQELDSTYSRNTPTPRRKTPGSSGHLWRSTGTFFLQVPVRHGFFRISVPVDVSGPVDHPSSRHGCSTVGRVTSTRTSEGLTGRRSDSNLSVVHGRKCVGLRTYLRLRLDTVRSSSRYPEYFVRSSLLEVQGLWGRGGGIETGRTAGRDFWESDVSTSCVWCTGGTGGHTCSTGKDWRTGPFGLRLSLSTTQRGESVVTPRPFFS